MPSKMYAYLIEDNAISVKKKKKKKIQKKLNSTKSTVLWSSKIPVRYKRNAITGELH